MKPQSPISPTPSRNLQQPGEQELAQLARRIELHTPYDGAFPVRLPGMYALKISRPNTELVHAVYTPSLCIVASGEKTVLLGSEVYDYDANHMLVVTIDLPVASQVKQGPFIGLKLDLEPERIQTLAAKVYPHGLPTSPFALHPTGPDFGYLPEGTTRFSLLRKWTLKF